MTKRILLVLFTTILFITVLVSCDNGADVSESVTDIKLDSSSVTIEPGESVTVLATVAPGKLSKNVYWYSTDTSVATVKNGVVTAVADGTVIIVCASDNGIFAKCTVTVAPAECVHEVEWTVVTEVTCTEDGKKIGKCELCGEDQIETITAPGHGYVIEFPLIQIPGLPEIENVPTETKSATALLICSSEKCQYHDTPIRIFDCPALSSTEYTVEDLGNGLKRYSLEVENENGEPVMAYFEIQE